MKQDTRRCGALATWSVGFTAILAVVAGAAVSPGMASAALVTLTFDELPFQQIDDVTFSGVTFDFKIGGLDSSDAAYNGAGPGTLTYVDDPSLEGNAEGVLTLDFLAPTPILEFGGALDVFDSLNPGISIELFDDVLDSLGTTDLPTDPLISFSEGKFTYAGIPVRRAILSFANDQASGPTRFVLDNLTFDRPAVDVIPEPASLLLLSLGIVPLLTKRHRRPIPGTATD